MERETIILERKHHKDDNSPKDFRITFLIKYIFFKFLIRIIFNDFQ